MKTLDSWKKQEDKLRQRASEQAAAGKWVERDTTNRKLRMVLDKIHDLKAEADNVLPEAQQTTPSLEELAPELIKIAAQGDVTERLWQLLLSRGYTEQDVWREIKKLNLVSSVHTNALLNRARDHRIGNVVPNTAAHDWEQGLRAFLKNSKKLVKRPI